MIIDTIENGPRYAALSSNFAKAFDFLRNTDLNALPLGKTEIDGENVFANVYEKVYDKKELAYECHAQYADIQAVVAGAERFALGWNPVLGEQKPGKDFWYGTAETCAENTLTAGQFVIYFPGELHAPGNPAGEPGQMTRKVVVKVKC